jgi:hypothetical protein
MRIGFLALLVTALGTLGLAGSASAKLTGDFTAFEQCPLTNPEAGRCFYSVVEGGEIVLGTAKVALVNPVTLQGGSTKAVEGVSSLVGAANGMTLSKSPQPVPGGLAGLVPSAKAPPLVKALLKAFSASRLNQVNATLELARPANEVQLSEIHFAEEEGVGMRLPVRVHLENPLLGSSCYIGSSTTPITLEFTTGTTSPPPPNLPIKGSSGEVALLDEGRVLRLEGANLVDNAWSAPKASGCGGILSPLVTPIINGRLGLPSAAGHNSAVLKSTISVATAVAVRKNDEENP